MSKSYWADEASSILKATIKRNRLTYDQLAEKLRQIGIDETAPAIKNKLARGTFSFAFVLQVMRALDRDKLNLG